MRMRGLEPRFHKGLRVTDGEALECVKRAMGVTRIEIEALLSQGLPNTTDGGRFFARHGGQFLSLHGQWGWWMALIFSIRALCERVIAEEIQADLAQENVVLITPISASPTGEIF
jgi:amino-acid N-acetyltransferase